MGKFSISGMHLHFSGKCLIKKYNYIICVCRSKEVDWMPYFTQRLVDDFASHIKLYRRATDKVNMSSKEGMLYTVYIFIDIFNNVV